MKQGAYLYQGSERVCTFIVLGSVSLRLCDSIKMITERFDPITGLY